MPKCNEEIGEITSDNAFEKFSFSIDGDSWQEEINFNGLTSDTYQLFAKLGEDCIREVAEINLKQKENPILTLSSGDTSICSTCSITLSDVEISNYASIQWTHNGSGELLNDEWVRPTYVPHSNDKGATVTLSGVIYSPYSCSDETIEKQIHISTLLGTNNSENKFIVYPNPTNRDLKIEPSSNVKYTYQLTSLSGQIVQESTVEQLGETNIDLSNMATGTYILRLKSDQSISVVKVVKSN